MLDLDKINALPVGELDEIHNICDLDFIANNGSITEVRIGDDCANTERIDC